MTMPDAIVNSAQTLGEQLSQHPTGGLKSSVNINASDDQITIYNGSQPDDTALIEIKTYERGLFTDELKTDLRRKDEYINRLVTNAMHTQT